MTSETEKILKFLNLEYSRAMTIKPVRASKDKNSEQERGVGVLLDIAIKLPRFYLF